ncbi:hypothetical protein [Ensifer sp. SSB1]|jgi:hypothetical protein|uniref:hypothetical protein n=1 Tax=Ensifer sp. SSB1 TaxID=2795385 RepID=UPI001A38D471|nr:hypothetical protein [Ensifer sp. SSB1]MBK5569497.1 hypothetical protein [Ensifer sp. SSB1]
MFISFRRLVLAGTIGLALLPGIAQAESYSTLAKQGYAIGKLAGGKSGAWGWVVANTEKKFFCRLNVASAYVNQKEMVSFTASGRMLKIDRATYDAALGGPDPNKPYLKDPQAGRVKPADVGGCQPLR